MSVLFGKMWQGYRFLTYDLADERTRDYWPGLASLLSIVFIYLYFCRTIGPLLMKDVKPFKLKNTILVYNFLQVILSSYIFYVGIEISWLMENDWFCQPVDYSDSPVSRRMIFGTWLYCMAKLTELLDTVFFVLRKKTRQISGLHLHHHTLMLTSTWIALKYYPNGHAIFLGIVNSFIHIIMYSYYFVAGLGPEYQKYLWWKRHLTSLQLIQFLIVFIQNLVPLFTDCKYPKWINLALSVNSLHFVYMFGCFYYDNYIKKNKKNKHKSLQVNSANNEEKVR